MAWTNGGLQTARVGKKDEFYTTIDVVSKECAYYNFKGGYVLCNCNDDYFSAFWRYFHLHFQQLELRKLVGISYGDNAEVHIYTGGRDADIYACDVIKLQGRGDFRDAECIKYFEEADFLVTNPPFSLFREYLRYAMQYEKKILILGNMNEVVCKDVFPLFKADKIFIGASIHGGDREFQVPAEYPLEAWHYREDADGNRFIRVPSIRWFTNIGQPHPLSITFNQKYTPEKYPAYDNYRAVEVGKVKDIPVDYAGVMGVPLTFFDKFNPAQFEIVGMCDCSNTSGLQIKKYTAKDCSNYNSCNGSGVIKTETGYKPVYARVLIRWRKVLSN